LAVDILIKNAFVLTMQGQGVGMIEDGAVAIEGNEIVAVGKTHQVESEVGKADRVFDARKKAVLPGFVDGHIHTGGTLLRGECQDVPEIEWMLKTVAPFSPHQTRELRLKGSRLGVLEALKSGTTCFGELSGDAFFLAEELYSKIGVRANLGSVVNEIGLGSRRSAFEPYQLFPDIGERKLKENLYLIDKWNGGAEGRISCMLGPHALDMLSEDLLMRMKEIAEEKDLVMHMHVAQGGRESIQIKLRYGTTSTVNVLDEIGFLDHRVLAAHCHHTQEDEVRVLAERGVKYVSCQCSIGIIDGITPPLHLYIDSGGSAAALGTDQANGNNCHNLLTEMKVAALLNKTRHRDPTVLPAWKMLRLATIEGATAIGLGGQIGSLEIGKKADLIIIDLHRPHLTPIISTPVRNIAPNIVYSARGDEVETVIIDGRVVVENGVALTLNEEEIMSEAQKAAEVVTSAAVEDFFKAGSKLAEDVKKGLL